MKRQNHAIITSKPKFEATTLRNLVYRAVLISIILLTYGKAQAQLGLPQVAWSKDSTLISYEVYGTGETSLVFIHGWSCDSRYWRKQIPAFSQNYSVVLIDLAGHGHSGISRQTYTMKAFGEDVQAVVESIACENVILIGHSMGGTVIAEAAQTMPRRIRGLIGVDTYQNIAYQLSQNEYDMMISPFKKDFQKGTRQFVQQMLRQETDAQLADWIEADMSSAPPSVAISAMEEYMKKSLKGEAVQLFEKNHIPVIAINADLWPTDVDANSKYMHSFEFFVIKNTDHFLMLDRADEFNRTLNQAIESIVEKTCN